MVSAGWDAEDERRVALAIREATDLLTSMKREAKGADIVFTVMENIVDIERRQQVRGQPARYRSPWPDYIHTLDEKKVAAKQRMIDVAAGDSLEAVFGMRVLPTAHEISTMESVNLIFRANLVGQKKDRDWRILRHLARGETLRAAGTKFGVSHTSVDGRKALQCQAIWRGMQSLVLRVNDRRAVREAA